MTDTAHHDEVPEPDHSLPVTAREFTVRTEAQFDVSELASSEAGASSPFGPEMQFPLPVEQLWYVHPRPEDRPNLALANDGRR